MKKAIKSFIRCSIFLLIGIMSSCSEKFELQTGNESEYGTSIKTCPMTFNGGVIGFNHGDTKVSTRSTTWAEGDKIYITFYNDTTKVPGEATYSTSNGWNVNYDGDLANGTNLKCEVRYFVNATFSSASVVSLNSGTEIYEALDGLYEYNGSSLNVQASMSPKTGRIRFSGKPEEKIHLTGISVYTTYSPALNTFSNTKSMITTTVNNDGYTPYIYGSLAEENKKLGLVGSDFAFTKTCTDAVLKVGDSGYMAIPSENSHNNWRSGLYITVNDVEFKMIPVAGLSSGFYLIGETEVTNALYSTILNVSTVKSNCPKISITYKNWESFITQLNYATNLTFDIPTEDEWKYAAKGGNKSQGYTYAGSNNPGDVAWYKGNSENSLHDVKKLAPNELGIYDMSGNAFEFVKKFSNGGSYYARYYGGYFGSYESAIVINDYNDYEHTGNIADYVGLRLILKCK